MYSKVTLVFTVILGVAFAGPAPDPEPQLGGLLGGVVNTINQLDIASDVALDAMCTVFKLGIQTFSPFDSSFTSNVCDMAKGWMKGMKGMGLQPPQYRMILTPNQRQYWDAVVNVGNMK